MSFTPAQQSKYRPLVERAWIASCAQTGTPPNDRKAKDTWYRSILKESAGIETTKTASPSKDFDKIMLAFAIIASDDYWMERLTRGDEIRMIWQINRYMQDLSYLQKRDITFDYIRAIHKQSTRVKQAAVPERLADCPAPILRTILAMLDTHIRRICADFKIKPSELPTRAHPTPKPRPIDPENHHLHVGHDLDIGHAPRRRKVKTEAMELPF